MPNPISSTVSRVLASGPTAETALEYCEHASGVVQGAFCGEDTVVSDACRNPTSAVEAFVCDDPKMVHLQSGVLDFLKSLAWTTLGALAGKP